MERICALFEHERGFLYFAQIVEARHIAYIKAQREGLRFAGGEELRLFERGELSCGLAELALRRAVI